MYYILDKSLTVCGVLSLTGKGCKFYNDSRTVQIAEPSSNSDDDDTKKWVNRNEKLWVDTLQISVPYGYPETDMMTEGYHLLKQGDDGYWYCFRIRQWDDTMTVSGVHVKTAYADNLFNWDLLHTQVVPVTLDNANSHDAFAHLLMATDWAVHSEDMGTLSHDETFSEGTTAQSMLDTLTKDYSLEIRAYVEVQNGQVVGKYIDLKTELGEATGRRIEYARNITGITRSGSDDTMFTKLFVYGGTPSSGDTSTPVNIASVNGGKKFLIDDDANDKYNNGKKYLEGAITNESILNQNALKQWGQNQFQYYNHPKYNYQVDVSQLDWTPNLGDHADVIDFEMQPELTIAARAIQKVESEANPQNNQVVLGEFIEIENITPPDVWQLQAQASQAAQAAAEAKQYKIETATPDGTDFSEGTAQKRIIVRVYLAKENVTAQIDKNDFTWQKIGSDGQHDTNWESQHTNSGNVLSVGSEVVGSTIRCLIGGGTSTHVRFAEEADAAYFATLPQDNNSGDVNKHVAQCAIVDDKNDLIYWSQEYSGSKKSANGGWESYSLTRTAKDGTYKDQMWVIGGGHGTSFGLEHSGSDTYIWSAQMDTSKSTVDGTHYWTVARFKYQAGKTLLFGDSSMVTYDVGGTYYRTYYDEKSGMVQLSKGTDKAVFYACKKSDIQAGKLSPVYTGQASDCGFNLADHMFQMSTMDFPYIYFCVSNINGDTPTLYCYDIRSQALVYSIPFNFTAGNIDPIGDYRELEGVNIYYDTDGKRWLTFMFSWGNESDEDSERTNQMYRIAEGGNDGISEGGKATVASADVAFTNSTEIANTANNTANTANTTATDAKSTATTAKSTADTAKDTANTAKDTADQAKTDADEAKNAANQANTLSQQNKELIDKTNTDVTNLQDDVANKADATWVDDQLKSKADADKTYSKTDVDNALKSKVDTTAYSTDKNSFVTRFTDDETQINQNATDIQDKVSSETYDQDKQSLESDISSVDQKATGLQTDVSKLQTTVNDHTQQINNTESNVTQLSDEVSNSVTKTQYNQDMSSVNSKIDGLQVGNRNLLSKSGNFTDTSSWFYSSDDDYKVDFDSDNQAFRLTVNSVATGMHFGLKTTRKPVFTPGDQYTFTICYSLSGDSYVGWLFGIGQGTGLGGLMDFPGTNGEFKIAYYTGTFTDALSEASAIYSSTTGLAAGTVVEVKWAMLTAGNKPATDWSPAPEDPAASANGIIDDDGNVYGFTTTTGTIKNIGTKIILKVDESKSDGDNLVSIFNMDSTTAKLKASKIDLQGAVTFSDFDSSTQSKTSNDNIQIGGTNLIPNSTGDLGMDGWGRDINGATNIQIDNGGYNGHHGIGFSASENGQGIYTPFAAISGSKQYTLSFFVRSNHSNTIANLLKFKDSDGNETNPIENTVTVNTPPTNEWRKYVVTFTSPGNAVSCAGTPRVVGGYYPAYIVVSQIKLEEGNKATTWSPAPEDLQSYASSQANSALSSAKSYTDTNYSGTKSLVNGWKASGTTKINGGVIQTDYLSSICANLGTINSGDINIGSGKFHVDSSGNLTATNANIKGTVNASGGSLSNMNINGQLRLTGSVVYGDNYWLAGDYQAYLSNCTMDGTVEISPGTQTYYIHLLGHISKAGDYPDAPTGDYGAMYLSPASMMMVDYLNDLRVSIGPGGPYYYASGVVEAHDNLNLLGGTQTYLEGNGAELYLDEDSTGPYLRSPSTASYHSTSGHSANLFMTSAGSIYYITSASRFKENVRYDLTLDDAKKILNVRPATWYDKSANEALAKSIENGTINDSDQDIEYSEKAAGFIAEDLEKAGLDLFVRYGEADVGGNRIPNGVEYDRIPVLHNMILCDHEQEINLLKTRVTVLETILKQKGIVA